MLDLVGIFEKLQLSDLNEDDEDNEFYPLNGPLFLKEGEANIQIDDVEIKGSRCNVCGKPINLRVGCFCQQVTHVQSQKN